MIVLDTQMWVWFNLDARRVPAQVRRRAADCAISVASVWEAILLVEKGRIASPLTAVETPRRWLERYPFPVLPLDFEIAVLSRKLAFQHEDPADRFIAATAHCHGAPLATSDSRLIALPWLRTITLR